MKKVILAVALAATMGTAMSHTVCNSGYISPYHGWYACDDHGGTDYWPNKRFSHHHDTTHDDQPGVRVDIDEDAAGKLLFFWLLTRDDD